LVRLSGCAASKRGYPRRRSADLAGIHRTYVSAIELGKVRLGLDAAKRVADGLGVSLAVLIEQAEELLRTRGV